MAFSKSLSRLALGAGAALVLAGPAMAQQGEDLRDTHGAWEIRCASGTDQCVMAQKGKGAEGNDVIDIRLRKLDGVKTNEGETVPAAIQITAPLGVLLPAGVQISVDGKKARGAPFETCNQIGCFVRQPISAEFLAELKNGNTAAVTVIAAPNKAVKLDISLKGFTKAFNDLKP